MNKEKQIEEMALIMCEDCAKSTRGCEHPPCDTIVESAEALYYAGYRKQSEIAEEIFNGLIKVFMAKQRHYENIRRPGKAKQMIEAREEIYKFKREYDERRADNG